ncbi:MAG: sirohydrochlorin cobaltochelatase [Clostridium fessum]
MEPRQAILVVSFGTSYNDSREKTIGAVERAVAEAFPAYEVRRAFTSQRIIDKLKKRDQRSIDNLKEALDRAAADGIKSLIVQPTHLMDGFEYMDVKAEVEANQGRFERLALGAPLLASEADLDAVILAMAGELGGYDDGKTALCLMGHGTDAASNQVYQKMQDRMIAGGYANYYIGTVEAQPDLQAVIEKLGAQKHYQRAVLQPLMVVAGDHANQDMAGEEEDSWKSRLERAGYQVECRIRGLGEVEAIRKLYVAHVKSRVGKMKKIGWITGKKRLLYTGRHFWNRKCRKKTWWQRICRI